MISYRTATVDDINDLVSLRIIFLQEVEKNCNPKYDNKVRNSIYAYFMDNLPKKTYISWLALDDDKIVGTSGLSFNVVQPSYGNPSGKEAYIMNMYTIPEYRKKGIAKNLLDKTMEEAKKREVGKIRLHATSMGRPIYLKKGFEERNDEVVLFLS